MKVLITGGAGFIGRWVAKKFLTANAEVYVYDNLSNGRKENISEFIREINFVNADIRKKSSLERVFRNKFDICIHAAAQISVQASIDNPSLNFDINVVGSNNVLEECHKNSCKMVHLSSCMVYDYSQSRGIGENHKLLPRSPYASSKLSTDYHALAYHYAYGDQVTIVRPFNTYGPFQKDSSEGGVVSIFLGQHLHGLPLTIYKSGLQSRDLLYVEDCAEFIYLASISKTNGLIFNAGYDEDIMIKDLAKLISHEANQNSSPLIFLEHPHPQSEIKKLLCDSSRARELLKWKPKTKLTKGIEKLREWMKDIDR